MKIYKFRIALFLGISISVFNTNFANATVNIANGDTTNVGDVSVGDTVNFLGNTGTLAIDVSRELTSITATTAQKGTINFISTTIPKTLTLTGNIGTLSNPISNIIFNANGSLDSQGDIRAASGITTAVNNQGNLTLSGTTTQTISAIIGSSALRLNTISITQSLGAITFSGDVNANNLVTGSSGTPVVINGAGALNFNNSTFNHDATISNTGTISLGATTIANTKTLTLNSSAALTDLTFGSSGNVVLASGKIATITGNVAGTGVVKGSANNVGDVLFSGSLAQTVAATAQIGDVSNRLNKVSISNIHASGVTFNNDVFTTTLDFANTSGTATATIATGKVLNIGGNITQSGAGSSTINGAGTITMAGSAGQTLGIKLGTSTSSRLSGLTLSNVGGVTLNQNSFINVLTTTLTTALTNNGALDVSTFNVNETTTVTGSGTNNLGVTTLANAKTLTLNSNASLSGIAFGSSGNLVIASGKTATIAENVSGTGLIKGAANNVGNVLFAGSTAQTVTSTIQLGDVSNRLSKVGISHINGINFNNDVFTNTFDFSNNSGIATATIATSEILNIAGNVTQSGSGSSVITGAGKVSLSGSSSQTVSSKLGSGTSDRLGELEVNNSAGIILTQDAFLTALTQTSGAIKISNNKTVDVTNAVDLVGKTLNIGVGLSTGNVFGKIKSSTTITVDNTTTINFDYSNNSLAVNGSFDNIAESSSPISNISDIIVTDNSFLFKNTLTPSGNNILSTISSDDTNFNINTIGADNYELLNNALGITTNSKLSAGLLSISNQQQLEDGLKTLKPVANGSIAAASMSVSNSTINVVNSRMQKANLDVVKLYASAGDSFPYSPPKNSGKIWGQVFGNQAKQNKVKESDGYVSNSGGIMFGADHVFKGNANVTLGAALAYSVAGIDHEVKGTTGLSSTKNKDQNDINSYQVIFYNNNATPTGTGFYNNNIINFSYNRYKSIRNIVLGSTTEIAEADYGGYSYGAKTDIGYNFKLSSNILLGPDVGIKYFSLTQDDYQETGAGNDGLMVKNKNYSNAYSEIGLNLISYFKDEDFNYIPRIRTSWEHSLTNNEYESSVKFIGGGTEMQNNSNNIQTDRFNLGLGLDVIDSNSSSSVALDYNLQVSERFVSNGGSIQYKYRF